MEPSQQRLPCTVSYTWRVLLKFTHVLTCVSSLFLFIDQQCPLGGSTTYCLSTYQGDIGFLFLLSLIMLLRVITFRSLRGHAFRPWADTYKSVITGKCDNVVFPFQRNCQTADGTILPSYQQDVMGLDDFWALGLFHWADCTLSGTDRVHLSFS